MIDYTITTIDNPFDPYEQYGFWESFDRDHGYNSMNLLMRFARVSIDLEEHEYNDQIRIACEKIVELFPSLYKVVSKEIKDED